MKTDSRTCEAKSAHSWPAPCPEFLIHQALVSFLLKVVKGDVCWIKVSVSAIDGPGA